MLLSKLYNRNKEKLNELVSGSNQSDPRVITPSNIPIFIVPTRLDEISHQPHTSILHDSYEEPTISAIDHQNELPLSKSVNNSNYYLPSLFSNKLDIGHRSREGISSRSGSRISSRSSTDKHKLTIHQNNANNFSSMQNLKAPHSNITVTTTTKTIIKTLFRKGLMNMAPEHVNDEKRFKENYCDLWVRHGGVNSCEQSKRPSFMVADRNLGPDKYAFMSKSTSILNKHEDDEYLNKSQTEEQLQREYLSNLSHQLEIENPETSKSLSKEPSSEKETTTNNSINFHLPTTNSLSTKFSEFRRESRSKSETFLSINSIITPSSNYQPLNTFLHNNSTKKLNTIIQKHGIERIVALTRQNTESTNRTKPQPQLSQQFLNMPGNVEARRFSFRNYFFSKTKPSQSIDIAASGTSSYNLKKLLYVDSGNSRVGLTGSSQARHLKAKSFSSLNSELCTKEQNGKVRKKIVQSQASLSNPNCTKLDAFGKGRSNIEAKKLILRNLNQPETQSIATIGLGNTMPQSSTANFPFHHNHQNHNDSVIFKEKSSQANVSDESETSDVDMIFDAFYQRNQKNYKKAKSVGRLSSNNSLKKRKKSGLNDDNNSRSNILSKSYRNILSSFLRNYRTNKNKKEACPELNISSVLNSEISIKNNCNKINVSKCDEVQANKRRNFFKRINENDYLRDNFKVSQCSSAYSDDLSQFKRVNETTLSTKSTRIDYSNPANFDLHSLNLTQVENAFKKNSLLTKHNETVYLRVNKSLMSTRPSTADQTPGDNESTFSTIRSADGFLKNATNFLGFKTTKTQMFAILDVSIERVAQSYDTHVLSMSLQNLKVEPLFEVNHIKSKLTYLTIQLIDSNSFVTETTKKKNEPLNESSACSNSTSSPNKSVSAGRQSPLKRYNSTFANKKKMKYYAKVTRNKTQKCKFNANNRSFQKPVEFTLFEDHFMKITDEAVLSQMQKNFRPHKSEPFSETRSTSPDYESQYLDEITKGLQQTTPLQKHYVFIFSIELHSYLPISRKTLTSTFRKKKRVFKGHCQIYENFISNTQFSKKFELFEV